MDDTQSSLVQSGIKHVWTGLSARPGWFPLLMATTVYVMTSPAEWWPWEEATDHVSLTALVVTLLAYQAGEVLDDSPIGDRLETRFARPDDAVRAARHALGVDHGSYAAALSVVQAAKAYRGSRAELYNEGGKAARGAAFLLVILAALRGLPSGPAGVGLVVAVAVTWAALIVAYAHLKQRHKELLYLLAVDTIEGRSGTDPATLATYHHVDLDEPNGPGARLFFWDGQFAGAAIRATSDTWRRRSSDRARSTGDGHAPRR